MEYSISVLEELEAEAIHALREAASEFKRPALLVQPNDPRGACLVRLAQRAFAPAAVPFDVLTSATAGGHDALITGERRGPAGAAGPVRMRPLADWTDGDVRDYVAGRLA